MASEYGILTIADLKKLVGYDITAYTDNAGTTQLYTDDEIEALITYAEEYIFAYIHTTYTSSTIPVNVKWAIKSMAKIFMLNRLIADEYIKGKREYNEEVWFEKVVQPRLENEEQNAAMVEVVGIDDYELSS